MADKFTVHAAGKRLEASWPQVWGFIGHYGKRMIRMEVDDALVDALNKTYDAAAGGATMDFHEFCLKAIDAGIKEKLGIRFDEKPEYYDPKGLKPLRQVMVEVFRQWA